MPRLLASSNSTRTTTRMELRRLTHIVAGPMKGCPQAAVVGTLPAGSVHQCHRGERGVYGRRAVGAVARKQKT